MMPVVSTNDGALTVSLLNPNEDYNLCWFEWRGCRETATHTIINGEETENYCPAHFDEMVANLVLENDDIHFLRRSENVWELI